MKRLVTNHSRIDVALLFVGLSLACSSSGSEQPARTSMGGGIFELGNTGTAGRVGGSIASEDAAGGIRSVAGGDSAGVIGGRATGAGGISAAGGETTPLPGDCAATGIGAPDLETDNNNCGNCGNVCTATPPSTAQCTSGRCLVTYVLGPQVVATDFAVSPAKVYFATSEVPGVLTVPINGGVPSPVEGTGFDVKRIAVFSTSIYYADSQTVHAWDSVMSSSWTLSKGQLCKPFNLLGNATNVFWLTRADCLTSYPEIDGKLMAAVWEPGTQKMQVLVSGGPTSFTLDAKSIYWTGPDSVMKMPLSGGTPTVLASGQKAPRGIAVDGASVYWNNSGTSELGYADGMVMKVPLDGGTPSVLALGQPKLGDIAADAAGVFWSTTDGSGTKITKLSSGSGTPGVLATGNASVAKITVDATSVYWLSNYRVMRLTPK